MGTVDISTRHGDSAAMWWSRHLVILSTVTCLTGRRVGIRRTGSRGADEAGDNGNPCHQMASCSECIRYEIDTNDRKRADRINISVTQDCFARTTTLFYCIDCLKQKYAPYADTPYAWGGQEEKLCKRAGYSERPS